MKWVPCRHRWKVVDKEYQASQLEKTLAASKSFEMASAPGDFAKAHTIVTYRCDKCGTEKVRRI